jgi:transcriptional regulator with XRE-family HTH domain
VPRSYVTNLRKGRIESPGYEKLVAIAKAMGFPPGAWFEDGNGKPVELADRTLDIAGRVEHLFKTLSNPKTDRPYTSAEVARLTLGELSEKDVEGIRTGSISDPTVSQAAALAAVFGLESSYLLERGAAPFDRELMEALRDAVVQEATREISRLPEHERQLVLGIVRQFGDREPGG